MHVILQEHAAYTIFGVKKFLTYNGTVKRVHENKNFEVLACSDKKVLVGAYFAYVK